MARTRTGPRRCSTCCSASRYVPPSPWSGSRSALTSWYDASWKLDTARVIQNALCWHLSARISAGQGTVSDLSDGVLNNPRRLQPLADPSATVYPAVRGADRTVDRRHPDLDRRGGRAHPATVPLSRRSLEPHRV